MCSTNIYSDSTLKIVDGVNDIGYENLLDLLQYNQCLSWVQMMKTLFFFNGFDLG